MLLLLLLLWLLLLLLLLLLLWWWWLWLLSLLCSVVGLNVQKWSERGVFFTFWHRNVLCGTTACTFWTSQLQKVIRTRQFLTLLTSKCALRHNGMHFLNISTSESALSVAYFVHVDFEMCFAPQTACTFQNLNFQKCSEPVNFLILLSSKCASHHHFFDIRTWGVLSFSLPNVLRAQRRAIFHLSSGQTAPHRFSEPTFRPSGATNHWKTRWVATFLPFRAPASDFFWLFLFSDLLSSSLLFLTLPTSAFPSLHIVRFDF